MSKSYCFLRPMCNGVVISTFFVNLCDSGLYASGYYVFAWYVYAVLHSPPSFRRSEFLQKLCYIYMKIWCIFCCCSVILSCFNANKSGKIYLNAVSFLKKYFLKTHLFFCKDIRHCVCMYITKRRIDQGVKTLDPIYSSTCTYIMV